MIRRPSLSSPFSNVEILENRAMLSASVHSSGEAVHHHRNGAMHVELHHSNMAETTSGKFRVVSDDKAGHDANDDKGVDAAEAHKGKSRGGK